MGIIDKQILYKYLEPLLVENKIPLISDDKINEFKIGKTYFYEVKNVDILNLHAWLNDFFLEKIEINNLVTSFRKNYSYLDFFEPHRLNYNFLRLDIKSFFHSIELNDIQKIFSTYIQNEPIKNSLEQKLIDAFVNVISYKIPENSLNAQFRGKQVLPMGFKTSPLISNIIFRQLDIQLQKFTSQKDIEYTRYADDMLFSSKIGAEYIFSESFINEIRITLNQMKFKINKKKTLASKHTLSLNGYTIQYSKNKVFLSEQIINELRFSNKRLEIINKLCYMKLIKNIKSESILKKLFNFDFKKAGIHINDPEVLNKYYDDQLKNKVTGYRSYLISIIKFNEKHECTQKSTIVKYIKLVNKLEIIIKDFNRSLNTRNK